jgi:hypothetical protein
MKNTKANTILFVRKQLSTNPAWAVKALVRIYAENQTENEKVRENTTENNGTGFNGQDGQFLSSLAKQYINKGFLSEKQLSFVMKKMSKYARQVVAFSDTEKLAKMVEMA